MVFAPWPRMRPFGAARLCYPLVLSLAVAGCEGAILDPAPPDSPLRSDGGVGTGRDGSNSETDDGGPADEGPTTDAGIPVTQTDPLPVHSGLAKVKMLLSGLPVTASEYQAVQAEPAALKPLIETWMATPEFEQKMRTFFTLAFQQTDRNKLNLTEGLLHQFGGISGIDGLNDALIQNIMESFPRTVVHMVNEGRPFTEVVTTRSFMMTTAMMVLLAFHNDRHIADRGRFVRYDSLEDVIPATISVTAGSRPYRESLDPNHANFMQFQFPDFPCASPSVSRTDRGRIIEGLEAMFGSSNTKRCGAPQPRFITANPPLRDDDYRDWRWVTVSRPEAGQAPHQFYELETLRQSSSLRTNVERVGFFSTPAFFSQWPSNEDNSLRVTLNQALIVALGISLEIESAFIPVVEGRAVDEQHADPTTVCYACHQTVDPMRQFFRQTYSAAYHEQRDSDVVSTPARYLIGEQRGGQGVGDLADLLAADPSFASAWVQRLCRHANSDGCPENDAFERIRTAFIESSFDFKVLVRELFSSSLITGAEGQVSTLGLSVMRGDHFCDLLERRLGLVDACGQDPFTEYDRRSFRATMAQLASSIPRETFSRAKATPIPSPMSVCFRGPPRSERAKRSRPKSSTPGIRRKTRRPPWSEW